MYAYNSVMLPELHLDPRATSLSTSRRAAERFALLQAVRAERRPAPVRLPVTRRLLAVVRPQRTAA